jgi:methionine--tRNA ligase beta chain
MTTENVFAQLNTHPRPIVDLKEDFYNLSPGTKITVGPVLFEKMVIRTEKPAVKPPADLDNVVLDADQPDFCKLDFRVGKIIKIWNHPVSEKMYCEEIDLGESAPRVVVSAIRAAYAADQLLGKMVIVLCNVKEAKLAGTMSCGLVLTATNEGRIEVVEAPASCTVGEKVCISDGVGKSWPANSVKKHKVWEAVKAEMFTDTECEVTWKGLKLLTSSGPCRVLTLVDSPIN